MQKFPRQHRGYRKNSAILVRKCSIKPCPGLQTRHGVYQPNLHLRTEFDILGAIRSNPGKVFPLFDTGMYAPLSALH